MFMRIVSLYVGALLSIATINAKVVYSSEYLYFGKDVSEEDVMPIIDYVSPDSKTDQSSKDPIFLTSADKNPRVVEFYSPWCGHCRNYKPHYIKLGRSVQIEAPNVIFHAISCAVHHTICNDQNIHGYPTVKFFPPSNGTGIIMERNIAATRFVQKYLNTEPIPNNTNKDSKETVDGAERIMEKPAINHQQHHGDHMRSQEDLFSDASESFDFALRNSIFMTNYALTENQSTTFKSWLQLLQKTLPHKMVTPHRQITALLENFHKVTRGEDELLEVLRQVENYKEKGPGQFSWTMACTHGGDAISGYTCGLWELFHIMTVGLVQWNDKSLINDLGSESSSIVSTAHAADTLRNYIEHFFACNACRANFIAMYDGCEFHRCDRLTSDTSNHRYSEWKQLSLWLWETHNDVNVRLLNENLERENLPKPTAEEEQKVRWPSKLACPRCWNEGGSWNEDEIFSFLQKDYWPNNENIISKTQKELLENGTLTDKIRNDPSLISHCFLALALFSLSSYYVYLQREKLRSGRHKKMDDSQRICNRNKFRGKFHGSLSL